MLRQTVRSCALAALCLFACTARADIEGVPKYDHIFVIILENHGFDQIIGNKDAPALNDLADKHGLAVHYYGVVHPSKANYIAMIAGKTFGIHDDGSYEDRTLSNRSLIDQLKEKGLTWKGYYQSLPAPGSTVVNDSQDPHRALYASKHNAFINFMSGQAAAQNFVRFNELEDDLASGQLPNYAHIVPDQCHDMHGMNPDLHPPQGCTWNTPGVITSGDDTVKEWVTKIMAAKFWNGPGNNAIVITWDEDNKFPDQMGEHDGCCGFDPHDPSNSGGGRVATIVITNNGPGHIVDDGMYNHYSLLRTTEAAFGITEFLNIAGHAHEGVHTMAKLFAVK